MMKSEELQVVVRTARGPNREKWVARYALCREKTGRGSAFYYIKCVVEVWEGDRLVRELLEVAGGLGGNLGLARRIYLKIVSASALVSPYHLSDIIRDEVALATMDPEAGRPGMTGL